MKNPSPLVEASTARRRIRFHSLGEAVADARHLASIEHRTLGNWSLGQICLHLGMTLRASIDGMDLRNHRWKRRLMGRSLYRYSMRHGIPRGFTVDANLTPPPDVELTAGLAALIEATERYERHAGPLRPHALFGRLVRAEWDRMHRLHAAHHLSYVIPSPEIPSPVAADLV